MSGLRSLQRARTALCPTCGAPLPLDPDAARVACAYCGQDAVVERRLRTVEVDLVAGTDPALVARSATPFLPAHALTKGGRTQGQCPSCAAPLDVTGAPGDHFDCSYCGMRSKVETRLAPDSTPPLADAEFDADLARGVPAGRGDELRQAQRNGRLADAARFGDELVDLTARVMLTAANDTDLCKGAAAFEAWSELNPWREVALARLMERACRVGPEAERALVERVVAPTAAAAWKYDAKRASYVRGVVRAAGRVLLAPRRSAALLDALAFAQPVALLKLLLEAAEWALVHGHASEATAALAAAGAALDFRRGQYHVWRDKFDRGLVGEVLLYRLLYLPPPLLAWALDQLPRWQVQNFERAARFMDDCAHERPELAPLLLNAGLARPAAATTYSEYAAHLDLVESLATDAARRFALRARTFDPEGSEAGDEAQRLALVARLEALAVRPGLGEDAGFELTRLGVIRESWTTIEETAETGELAQAVALCRGRVERDYEATRVDDDLDEARRNARFALEDAARGLRLSPSDNAYYVHESRLGAAWLGYRATLDSRFKRVIAAHEAALRRMTRD